MEGIMTLGEKIKARRKELGLTQEDLAGHFLSRAMISLIERDQTTPSLKALEYLSNKLGLTISDLLDKDEVNLKEEFDAYSNSSKLLNICKSLIKSKKYAEAEGIIKNALSMLEESSTIKGSLLLLLGKLNIKKENTETAIELINEALIYIPAIELHEHIGAYHHLSEAYKILGDFHSSIENALYAILLIRKSELHNDQQLLYIKLLYTLSYGYCRIDEYSKGIEYIDEAITFEEKSGIFYLESSFLMLKGLAHLYLKNFEDGIISTEKALALFREPKDISKIVGCVTNLGILYRKINKLDRSVNYLKESLELCIKNNFDEHKINNLYELSLTYFKNNDFEQTILYASEGFFSIKNAVSQTLKGKLLFVLAFSYCEQQHFSESLTYVNQAENIFRKEESTQWIAKSLALKADIFFKQDLNKDAFNTLKNALNISLDSHDFF
jgi:tetratricopeptide (TPR) repeat protein